MPTVNLPQTGFGSQEEIADGLIATNRMLTYLLYNLEDQNISSLSADKITAGTIDAGEINVTNLDADNINTGTLTAIDISACDIRGSKFYDDSEDAYLEIDADLGWLTSGMIFNNNLGTSNYRKMYAIGVNDDITYDNNISHYAFNGDYGVGEETFIYMSNGYKSGTGDEVTSCFWEWDFSNADVTGFTAVFG